MKSLQCLRVEFTDGRLDDESPARDAVVHLLKPMVAVKFPKYIVQFDWLASVDELVRLLGTSCLLKFRSKRSQYSAFIFGRV